MSVAPEVARQDDARQAAGQDGGPESRGGRTFEVRRRLQAVHQEVVRHRKMTDALRAALLLVVLLAGLAALDSALVLAFPWRVAGLLLAVAGVVLFGLRAARRRADYTEADVAAAIEARFPGVGQRIRTSRDYGDSAIRPTPASPGLVELLQRDTQQQTQNAPWREILPVRPLLAAAAATALALLVCLVALIAQPELWISLGRSLLLPLHYSHVVVTPAESPVAAGETVTIQAEVSGRPVPHADLYYRPAGSQEAWSRLPLLPAGDERNAAEEDASARNDTSDASRQPGPDSSPTLASAVSVEANGAAVDGDEAGDGPGADQPPPAPVRVGKLVAALVDCREDLEYRVSAGPFESEVWKLQVLQPLELRQFTARVEAPAYTGIAAESVEHLDLKVVEGSTVQWEMRMNRPPRQAQLIPLGEQDARQMEQAVELEIVDDSIRHRWENLRESATWMVIAETDDGMKFESPRLRIGVQPDAKPRIHFVRPPEDLEVTPTTEVTLAVEASDDYGVSRLGIACKVGDGPMETMWSQEMARDPSREIQLRPVLYLEDFGLNHQDAVTYYAFVEDNYPGEPRRTTTELRFIDIRPFKREYQILPASGGT